MRISRALAAALVATSSVGAAARNTPARREYTTHDYYLLEHNPRAAGAASLDDVASALGVHIVERAGELADHWLVRREKDASVLDRRTDAGAEDTVMAAMARLRARAADPSSSWFTRRSEFEHARRVVSAVSYLEKQIPRRRVKRASPPVPGEYNAASSADVATHFSINDPLFKKQWHLVNEEFPEHSMNATGVWEMGITGQGIISALVDDGLDYNSDDLAANFDAFGSYDFNDHVDLPTPVLSDDHHGTRCAGQIAAVKNDVCGVGLAYDSKVAGIRILSGPISDIDEAHSLNYGFQNTSIFSCSWGPSDDGRSMEAPGYLVEKAVVNGINNGRGGKGSVFVFAAGNGAGYGDQCNFDGYTNSIYSITVAAIDYKGLHPPYSESCAANMVTAYTSGSGNHITTTDVGKDKCSSSHGGTSAAAPNAVGVFALALSTRPELTWRDMQHLAVNTAVHINPDDPDWEKTAQGRPFSYKYGFGSLNAYAYVTAAKQWKLVKPQSWLQAPAVQIENGTMNLLDEMNGGTKITQGGVTSKTTITQDMLKEANLERLEHVTIKVWIKHTKRGDVEVELVSPNGVKSVLASTREHDRATTGFPGWRFMSVKHWDENPVGDWTIRVSDQGVEDHEGFFIGWSLSLWGESIDPSKTTQFVVPVLDNVFPPLHPDEANNHPAATSSTAAAATSTKQQAKPTAVLPTSHGTDPGEADHPAFPGANATTSAAPSASATQPAADDEGYIAQLGNLVSDQRWLFGAGAVVLIFAVGIGVFFWRRRAARRRRSQYAAVAGGDEVAMSGLEEGRARPRTKELYDAFGEVSDDDDDADEETRLRARDELERSRGGVGFHSGFLDDDDDQRSAHGEKYHDEPTAAERTREAQGLRPGERDHEAHSSGSGSPESWEHASTSK